MKTPAAILTLALFVGCSANSPPVMNRSSGEKPSTSPNSPSLVEESNVDKTSRDDKGPTTIDCADPKGFTLEEGTTLGSDSLNIVRKGRVLHTINLLTDLERNGFAFDGAKKNKDGFELSVEYGSVIYYHKTFIFTCREHLFYLTKIKVDTFDKRHPEKWSKKVVNVQPNLPLEKFSITDFMLEGVAKH